MPTDLTRAVLAALAIAVMQILAADTTPPPAAVVDGDGPCFDPAGGVEITWGAVAP